MRFLSCLLFATMTVSSVALLSCNKEKAKDTTGPDITLHAPEEGEKLVINNPNGVHLSVDFIDSEGLQSYSVDIHAAFDGHKHDANVKGEELTSVRAEDTEEAFSYKNSWNFEGKLTSAHVHQHEIKILERDGKKIKPGKYHFGIYAVDKNGNQSHIYRNIELVKKDEHAHETEAHFHVHRMPVKDVFYFTNLITVQLEGHSEADPVKSIRVMLLPPDLVGKSEAEWQAAATPEKCFAVMGEVLDKNEKELELEATIMLGEKCDNAGGEKKGKLLAWKPGKYIIYAVGETVGGKKFYLPVSKAKVIEVKEK